jgi:proteic killer suppression protein
MYLCLCIMKVAFETEILETLFLTPLNELRGKQKYPVEVIKQFKKKVQFLIDINRLEQLSQQRGFNFEYLKGDRKGTCSIRLNDQYRLIFVPTSDGAIQVLLIKEISRHYA